jgi:hypothetical protein
MLQDVELAIVINMKFTISLDYASYSKANAKSGTRGAELRCRVVLQRLAPAGRKERVEERWISPKDRQRPWGRISVRKFSL